MMVTTTDFTNPVNWLIAIALFTLLLLQGWLLWRNKTLSPSRKGLRMGLNGLLWLVMAGYFLQPQWPSARPTTHALLVGDDIPQTFARHIQDSLHIQDVVASRMGAVDYDSVTLVGQRFPAQRLAQLSNARVQWIRYDEPNRVADVRWKGIVQAGEMQRISGRIQSSGSQLLRLRYGRKTLDSTKLTAGDQPFAFQFPAFSKGRTQVELLLGDNAANGTALDTIRFFTRAIEPLRVQILQSNPDFDSKTLADWFGKNGHSVQLSATLSKNMNSSTTINKSGKPDNRLPDLLITEPANAASVSVRKAVADGRSVLFIGLTDPEGACRTINQGLGTRFQVKKVSNEPAVSISNDLTALPYQFTDAATQFRVARYPVAVQRTASRGTTGRVGVSLLNETFPLSLSGDSVAYNQIWTAILARLYPPQNTVSIEEPVVSGLPMTVQINNRTTPPPTTVRIGSDTIQLTRSPLNDRTVDGWYRLSHAGWQPVNDSLSIFVEAAQSDNLVVSNRIVSQFMLAHTRFQFITSATARPTNQQLPGWVWLLIFVGSLTALWIEPKLI